MKLFVICVLFVIQGAICKSINGRDALACSAPNINHIKQKYIKKIEHEVKDLRKVQEITSQCSEKVEAALRRLRKDIEEARPSSSSSENINECLDGLYENSNEIEYSYEEVLDKKCYTKIEGDVQQVNAQVGKAIFEIENCAQKPEASCKSIKHCCKDVEEDFDDQDVDDDVEDLLRVYKKCIGKECSQIEHSIEKLRSQVSECTQLTGSQETTSVESETEDPTTSNTEVVDEESF